MTAITETRHELRATSPRTVVSGFVLVAAACVLCYEALATSDRPSLAVVWGGVALAAYTAGLLCLIIASQGAGSGIVRWKIGPWMLLWYAAVFGVATVTWSRPQTTGVVSEIAIGSVLTALWMMAVGISAWIFGYLVGPGQVLVRAGNRAMAALVRQPVNLTPSQGVATAPSLLEQTVTSGESVSVAVGSIDYLVQRIREIDNVAIVVQRTPKQLHFVSPFQLAEAPVIDMIPRAIWPGKPILATGYQFSQEFYELPASVYTSSTDTMVGGLYWHGGWISVIIGMAIFGGIVRLLDEILDARANPHAIFLLLLLFPALMGGETDWSALLGALPTTLFVWLLSIAIIFRSRRRERA